MKTILVFFRQQMRLKAYYLGSMFWALGVLFSELGKAKKDLVDSGMASEDSKAPLLYSLAALLFMGIACVFLLEIIHRLRAHFTKYHPSAWHFGLSFTWAAFKLFGVFLLTLIPGIIYMAANIQRIMIDPTASVQVMATVFLIQMIFLPLWIVMGSGGIALSVSRGTAYHTTRDSFAAFRKIWREALLSLFLMFIPVILLIPIRILSLKYTSLEYVAITFNVCVAPYSFGLMAAVYLYLARLLTERAPALADAHPVPNA